MEHIKTTMKLYTDLYGQKNLEILNAVLGQLSDGMWENSSAMEKYWRFASVELGPSDEVMILVKIGYESVKTFGLSGYKFIISAFNDMSEEKIKFWFADKIKQIIKKEGLIWKRDNFQQKSGYLSYNIPISVADAYRAYDKLKGRKDRVKGLE